MIHITLSPAARNRMTISARDGEATVLLDTFDPESSRSRDAVAKRLKMPADKFLQYVTKGAGEYAYGTDSAAASAYHFVYHTEDGTNEQDTGDITVLESLVQRSDGFLRWDDPTALAMLDCDHHSGAPVPTSDRTKFLMSMIAPAPCCWWFSRGGGVHAIYQRRGNYAADVLAAAAGFSFTVLHNTATFEVLTNTRAGAAELYRPVATDDLSSLRTFLSGGVSPADVENWLEERGMERNKSYPHVKCPVAGYSESTGTPVWVGENSITCHRCRGLGITFGSQTPGVFPYASLCGSRRVNEVATMVRNFTHFTHAEVVLESRCRLRGNVARLAYEGMLRLWHGDDERVDRVFSVGRSVIRGLGRWVTPGRNESLKDIRNTLCGFPAVQGDKGKPVPERLDMFVQSMELDSYGYQSIRPLHGMRVFGEFLGQENGPITIQVTKNTDPQLSPRYVRADQRLPIDTAWSRIETVFPNIDRGYVELLIVARGISEGEIGIPPNLLIVGPSSTGKTATVALAASMLGDGSTEVPWNANVERFRQGYLEGVERGSYVCVNELVKDATRARITPRQAFDSFLTITPDSVTHKLFHGPVALGRIPVTVVTDTYVPGEIRADIQLGRRFIYVRLHTRIDWETSLITSGVRQIQNFRNFSVENAEACNAIVSDIIDRFFREEPRNLAAIAKELGFDTLENCDEPVDDPGALAAFFTVCCASPDAEDIALPGRGWKKVKMELEETELAEAWRAVCDGEHSIFAFCSSRKCFEADWSTVVPVPVGTRLQVVRRGKSAAFRFVCGETRGRGVHYVNGELLTCEGKRREP